MKIKDTKFVSYRRLYAIRNTMIFRCYSAASTSYKSYGGRGISVCKEWLESYGAFEKWALENGYLDNLSIDRIDNNGNYEPSNCRWATSIEQSNNTSRNTRITIFGETKTIAEWSRDPRCNTSRYRIAKRLSYGWSGEMLLVKEIPMFLKRKRVGKLICAFGEHKSYSQWSKDPRCLISLSVLYVRISNGWNPEEAMTTVLRYYPKEKQTTLIGV